MSGAAVDKVENAGTVTTHGQNDMVLDNWGYVKEWVATAQVTSTGPSGIGFVNFGDIDTLDVQAPILTTGPGARGFNQYDHVCVAVDDGEVCADPGGLGDDVGVLGVGLAFTGVGGTHRCNNSTGGVADLIAGLGQ